MENPGAWHLTDRVSHEQGKGDPFAAAVRATRMPIIITDPRQDDNPIVFANDAFLRLTGYDRDEIMGRNCRFLQGDNTDDDAVGQLRKAIAERRDINIELTNYRKDGTSFCNELYVSPVFSNAGEVEFFFASQFDVTDRRAAQESLKQREAELRIIVESASDYAIIIIDADRQVTSWSKGAEQAFGWTAEETIGQSADVIFTPSDRASGVPEEEVDIASREGCADDERWHQRKDGDRVFMNGSVRPLPPSEFRTGPGFIKIARNETDRRGRDDRLRASEARLRAMMDQSSAGIAQTTLDGQFIFVNDRYCSMLGRSREELLTLRIHDLTEPTDLADNAKLFRALVRGGPPFDVEKRYQRPDGSTIWVRDSVTGVRDEEGRVESVFAVSVDINERRLLEAERDRATAEVRANEAKWRSLFETLEEGFILGRVVRNADGRVVDWQYEEVNNAWYDLVGIERGYAVGRTIRELFPGIEDEWVLEFAEVVETGEGMRFTRQVGNLQRWYDGVCQPIGDDRFTVIFLEVTDRIQAERRREAFVELGQVLSTPASVDEMSAQVTAIIGRALEVTRVGYGTLGRDGQTLVVPLDWSSTGTMSLAGTHQLHDFGSYAEDLRQGRVVVIPDIHSDPRTSINTLPLDQLGVRSLVNLPIVEDGRTVAVLYVNDAEPRAWTEDETAFLEDSANRIRSAFARRRAEEELSDSESFMRSVLAASTDCIKVLDLEGNLTFMSDGGMKVMEISDFNAVKGCYWPTFLKDDGIGLGRKAIAAARAGQSFHFEAPAETYLGAFKFWSVSVSPIFGENGRVERILAVSRDHTTLEEAREQQRLLNGELSHRLKNVLTIVQSIANQTMRDADTLEEASAAFSSRLSSLGRATDVLTATSWDAAELTSVLDAGLAVADGKRDRVSMGGPAVRLNSQSALALTLAVHELGTNALKYGALSNVDGIVTLTWEVTGSEDNPEFSLLWQERGGPIVSSPTRKGFGTRLIERSLRSYFRGETTLTYPPEGVEFRIKAPLSGAGELVTA